MKYLTLEEILELHKKGLATHGGDPGIRDEGLLESAVAQPQMTYGGQDKPADYLDYLHIQQVKAQDDTRFSLAQVKAAL